MVASALAGSEIIYVKTWECQECGDRWSVRSDENPAAIALLIKYHSAVFHGGAAVRGIYRVFSVIRPPVLQN